MLRLTKNNVIVAAVVLTTSIGFNGCKKGEDDPFLSLRSRKARVAGEWTVSESEMTQSSSGSNGVFTMNVDFDGSTVTQVVNDDGQRYTFLFSQKETYVFEKDGKYEHEQIQTYNGEKFTVNETGTWNFTGGVGEEKRKSKMLLTVSTIKQTSPNGVSNYTFSGSNSTTWELTELRNKKMVAKLEATSSGPEGTNSLSGTITLTQE